MHSVHWLLLLFAGLFFPDLSDLNGSRKEAFAQAWGALDENTGIPELHEDREKQLKADRLKVREEYSPYTKWWLDF